MIRLTDRPRDGRVPIFSFGAKPTLRLTRGGVRDRARARALLLIAISWGGGGGLLACLLAYMVESR